MTDIRIKTFYKNDKQFNDFLAQNDIEFIKLHVRPMEYVVEYKKIKKTAPKKVTA